MRILFVLSASIWAWLVARCIAFGPKSQAICWSPNMHADTWYRLTHIPYKIPHTLFKYIPIFIAFTSIPILYIDNDIIHVVCVLVLVAEHAFIPIFVAHLHSETLITIWAFVNVSLCALLFYLTMYYAWVVCIVLKMILHAWLCYMQIYIVIKSPIVTEIEYQERVPRIV